MEFKGTKGKWVKLVDRKNRIIVRGPQTYKERKDLYDMTVVFGQIFDDECGVPSCCKTEEHANAQLFSKAPEMLERLKSIISSWETLPEGNHSVQAIQDWIINSIHPEILKTRQLVKEATEL